MNRDRLALLVWLATCVGGGAVIGVATAGGDSVWYRTLEKPPWTPPSWVFAPVWTTLYAAMAVAAWFVWRSGRRAARTRALAAFIVQLTLNFAWSFIFFSAQRTGWALVDIVLLWIAIGTTVWLFARVDARAAWLLAPYWVWVTFAVALNAAIVSLQAATPDL